MPIESWLNRRAAQARLHELERQFQRLQQERLLLSAVISFKKGGSAPALVSNGAGSVAPRAGRVSRQGESMTTILADAIAGGPAGKGWTIGDLVASLRRTHPDRVRASNASSLISAALAQALRAKRPLFVSRKRRGKRSHLYRLASPKR
jgi:hypothetical protein